MSAHQFAHYIPADNNLCGCLHRPANCLTGASKYDNESRLHVRPEEVDLCTNINCISATRQGNNSLDDIWIQHPLFSQELLAKSAMEAHTNVRA